MFVLVSNAFVDGLVSLFGGRGQFVVVFLVFVGHLLELRQHALDRTLLLSFCFCFCFCFGFVFFTLVWFLRFSLCSADAHLSMEYVLYE